MTVAEAVVIIPHYNDVDRLMRCLEALMPMVDAANAAARRVEVMVVDNASTHSLDRVHAAYPDLPVVIEPKKGAAEARNRGIRETTAPRLFLLDADCLPGPDWIKVGLEVAGDADLVGGRVSVFDETPAPRSGAEAFETVFAFNFRNYVEKKGFSGTGNLLTRRDVFEAVGDFIPGLSEDLNWCHRATALGYTLVYEDRLQVGHPTRSDWSALHRKWERINAESFGLIGTGPVARLKWALRGIAMLPSIGVHGVKILMTAKLTDPREKGRAVVTLVRLRLLRCVWMLRQAATGR